MDNLNNLNLTILTMNKIYNFSNNYISNILKLPIEEINNIISPYEEIKYEITEKDKRIFSIY